MNVIPGLCHKEIGGPPVAMGAAAILLLTWLFCNRSNHTRRGLWPRHPLLSKERGWSAESLQLKTSRRLKVRRVKS